MGGQGVAHLILDGRVWFDSSWIHWVTYKIVLFLWEGRWLVCGFIQ